MMDSRLKDRRTVGMNSHYEYCNYGGGFKNASVPLVLEFLVIHPHHVASDVSL